MIQPSTIQLLKEMQFSTCKYIEDGHHVILKGASGNGKTYLASALGEATCRKFLNVRYIRMDGVDVIVNTSPQADSRRFLLYLSANFVREAQALKPCSASFPAVRKYVTTFSVLSPIIFAHAVKASELYCRYFLCSGCKYRRTNVTCTAKKCHYNGRIMSLSRSQCHDTDLTSAVSFPPP